MHDFSSLPSSSYYDSTAPKDAYASLIGRTEANVCIIGAGFAGLATALSLIERGERNVIVLEAESIGYGASGRNGGFVFGGFSLGERGLTDQVGKDAARQLYQLTIDAVAQIRRRIDTYQIECEATHAGVILANWFDDPRILEQQQRFMTENLGVTWQQLSRSELAEMLHTKRYFGGLLEENAFHFHPLRYALGIANVIKQQGGRIYESSRVIKMTPESAGWRVHTAQGEVLARDVVVCCGGYIERLYPRLASAIMPIATYVMTTEPLGTGLESIMKTKAAVYDTRFAFDYYRPLPDTRLLWGGRISIRDLGSKDVAKLLYRDMLKVYPQLAGTRIEYAWSGMMGYSRHKMLQLGRLPEGLWYGMGFGGHGVGPTTLAGELLARAILGDVTGLNRFAPWGLPSTLGPIGLFAAQLTYWYYELRDWLKE